MNNLSDEHPSKRPRIDILDLSLSDVSPYTHRRSLAGRATLSNAADSPYFSKSSALVYQFLDIHDVVEDDQGRLKSCTLKCGICHRGTWTWTRVGGSKGSTTNMNSHMRDKHPSVWLSAQQADNAARGKIADDQSASRSVGSSGSVPTTNTDELYRRLMRWVVTSGKPLAAVEDEDFQSMLSYLDPALEGRLPQTRDMQNQSVTQADAMRKRTKDYLATLPGSIAVGCDAWISPEHKAFLVITGSWITQDWRQEETILDFVELQGMHRGFIANAVSRAIDELGISDKVVAFVSDQVGHNETLMHHLEPQLRQLGSGSRWDGKRIHVQSLAHVIHHSVMALLLGIGAIPQTTNTRNFVPDDHLLRSEYAEAFAAEGDPDATEGTDQDLPDTSVGVLSPITKIRKIVTMVKSSSRLMEIFKEVATGVEDNKEQQASSKGKEYSKRVVKPLIVDIASRWNSVYLMLERALEFSEAINDLTSRPAVNVNRNYALSEGDWEEVSQVRTWLRHFRGAFGKVATEEHPTLGFSLRVHQVLVSYMTRLEAKPIVNRAPVLSGIQACKSELLKFINLSSQDSEYYYISASELLPSSSFGDCWGDVDTADLVLDPRFKDTAFSSNQLLSASPFSAGGLSKCASIFEDAYQALYGGNGGSVTHTLVESPEEPDDFNQTWRAHLQSLTYKSSTFSSITQEIVAYLSEPVSAMGQSEWWHQNAQRFPRLAAMARDFLCIPSTAVTIDRVLGMSRGEISVRRVSLSAEMMRKWVLHRAGILFEKSDLGHLI